MDLPTAAELRARLPADVDMAALGYPVPVPPAADPLTVGIARAGALLRKFTGVPLESIAPEDEPIAQMALDGLALYVASQFSADRLDTLQDFDLIQSFSAGPYSETRRNAEDALKARQLTGWPWLNDLLWELMTPEKSEEWTEILTGVRAPAFVVEDDIDWGGWDGGSDYEGSIWGDYPGYTEGW